jgi:hypothetical protein
MIKYIIAYLVDHLIWYGVLAAIVLLTFHHFVRWIKRR